MASNPECPAPAELKRLLDAALPESEQSGLFRHLEACPACQQRLQDLAAAGASWQALAGYLNDGKRGRGEALEQAMDKLRDKQPILPTQDEIEEREEMSLDFLDAPVKPRQLGKFVSYEIVEVVGRGGMGIVFKALDSVLHRIVAVKVMAPQFAASSSARQRFLREARAAAAVCHEHVVTIHAVGEAKSLPYLVMQFVAGVSLQERLENRGPLNLDEILRIGMQTAQGLAAAHAQGLVHRDIKPANILLENGVERVKITDFGLARAANDASLTQSGVIVGTPQYMAPEQARGETVDHRADLFSLGSVLYYLCTGQPPFEGDSSLAVIRRVCDEMPPPVNEINPKVPDWLVAIIDQLQAKEPDQRFPSATEVARLLGEHYARLQRIGSKAGISLGADSASIRRPREPNEGTRPVSTTPSDCAQKTAASKRLAIVLLWAFVGVVLFACSGILSGGAYWYFHKSSNEAGQNPEAGGATERVKLPLARPAHREDNQPAAADLPKKIEPVSAPVFPRLSEDSIDLQGHTDAVWSVAFSPDSKQLASGGKDRQLRLWDLASRKQTDHTGQFVQYLESMVYSKDGKRLYIGDGSAVRIWNIKDRKMSVLDQAAAARNRNLIWIHGIALSPDGKTLALGYTDHYYDDTGRRVVLWDLPTAAIRTRLPVEGMLGGGVYGLAYSPDGERLAIAKGDKAHIWRTKPNKEKEIAVYKGHNGRIRSLAYSPDGKLLATASFDKTARLWDGITGAEVIVLEGHTDRVHALAFSADGKTLATGSVDGTIRFWDVPSGRPQGKLAEKTTEGGALAFSPDGRYFAAGCLDKTVKLWTIAAKPRTP
jgi:serine/threonine protein kinase